MQKYFETKRTNFSFKNTSIAIWLFGRFSKNLISYHFKICLLSCEVLVRITLDLLISANNTWTPMDVHIPSRHSLHIHFPSSTNLDKFFYSTFLFKKMLRNVFLDLVKKFSESYVDKKKKKKKPIPIIIVGRYLIIKFEYCIINFTKNLYFT